MVPSYLGKQAEACIFGSVAIFSQAWGLWVGRAVTTVLGERSVFGAKFTVIQVKIA
jgi:hypothetical protein